MVFYSIAFTIGLVPDAASPTIAAVGWEINVVQTFLSKGITLSLFMVRTIFNMLRHPGVLVLIKGRVRNEKVAVV